ncbi:hypothetical protein HYX13_03085 [Candidatus Woesearchaeota archaeon]|nr:hypothetical protein [Candidatus Woesearchaeota archaeon]
MTYSKKQQQLYKKLYSLLNRAKIEELLPTNHPATNNHSYDLHKETA